MDKQQEQQGIIAASFAPGDRVMIHRDWQGLYRKGEWHDRPCMYLGTDREVNGPSGYADYVEMLDLVDGGFIRAPLDQLTLLAKAQYDMDETVFKQLIADAKKHTTRLKRRRRTLATMYRQQRAATAGQS